MAVYIVKRQSTPFVSEAGKTYLYGELVTIATLTGNDLAAYNSGDLQVVNGDPEQSVTPSYRSVRRRSTDNALVDAIDTTQVILDPSAVALTEAATQVRDTARGIHGQIRVPTGNAVFAFRFDDFPTEDPAQTVAALNAAGIPGTFGVIGSRIGTSGWGTSVQVADTHLAGHEIANHSWSHSPSGVANYAALTAQIAPASDAIQACLGTDVSGVVPQVHRPRTFIQPGPWSATPNYNFDAASKLAPDSPTGRLMRSEFSVVSGYNVTDKLDGNTGRQFPIADDLRFGGSSHYTVTDGNLAAAQAVVDAACAWGSQVTLLIHSYELPEAGGTSAMTRADVVTLINYVRAKVDAGAAVALTMQGAAHAQRGTPQNLLADPQLLRSATGAPVGWVRLGSTAGQPAIAVVSGSGPTAATNSVEVGYTDGIAWRGPASSLRSYEFTGWWRAKTGTSLGRIQLQQGPTGGSSTYQNRSATPGGVSLTTTWQRFRIVGRTDPRGGILTIRPWVQNSGQTAILIADMALRSV